MLKLCSFSNQSQVQPLLLPTQSLGEQLAGKGHKIKSKESHFKYLLQKGIKVPLGLLAFNH